MNTLDIDITVVLGVANLKKKCTFALSRQMGGGCWNYCHFIFSRSCFRLDCSIVITDRKRVSVLL